MHVPVATAPTTSDRRRLGKPHHLALWIGAALAPIACSKNDGKGAPAGDGAVVVTAAHRAEAKTTFETVCFACHGLTGHGDGPGSAALTPKPRDLTDRAWQTSVDDNHIEKVILMGGAAVGKSPVMPAHPQFRSNKGLLRALIEHVRNLGGKQ